MNRWLALVFVGAAPACALPHGAGQADVQPDAASIETSDSTDGSAIDTQMALDVANESAAPDVMDSLSSSDAADVPSDADASETSVGDVVPTTYATDPAHVMTTGWVGNSSPGPQTQIRCADNELVIGVLGNAGSYINSFGLNCAALNSDGTLGATHVVPRNGGSSDADFDEECPAGQVVVRERGHSGMIVDAWGATCASIDPWLSTMTLGMDLPVQGGTGGGAFSQSCPAGTFLHGLDYDVYAYPYAWSNNSVWRVAMECIPVIRTP